MNFDIKKVSGLLAKKVDEWLDNYLKAVTPYRRLDGGNAV